MKAWQKKSRENKYCFSSHSIQARIQDYYFPNMKKCCTKLATYRLLKRKARKRGKKNEIYNR